MRTLDKVQLVTAGACIIGIVWNASTNHWLLAVVMAVCVVVNLIGGWPDRGY